MKKKTAFITGISGQDGAYLAKFLVEKNYVVTGGDKDIQKKNLWRLKKLDLIDDIKIIPFDLTKENKINKIIKLGKFNEIYNLAAQSLVKKSFKIPIETSNVNTLGVIRLLEAIKNSSKKTKFYQASSSEMYGNVNSQRRNEKTNFNPISPYAVSKLHAHLMINVYRSVYNLFCCSGILFNHDSPLRGDEFVTKKIVSDLIKVKYKELSCLTLGNIYVKRDWGYALDYVEAMWLMLQQKFPDDYVISSGATYNVKSFVQKTAKYLGIDLTWKGTGINERGIDKKSNKIIVKIDQKFFRPNEIKFSYGNSNKAKKILNWSPTTNLDDLVSIMCESELIKYKK